MKHPSHYTLLFYTCVYSSTLVGMEQPSLLYMPWRGEYNQSTIQSSIITTQEKKPCIFCKIGQEDDNEKNYVIHKGKHIYIALATQPYISSGVHLLILPFAHGKQLHDLPSETIKELNSFTKKLCTRYSAQCNEIHVGFNIGKYAGASIPDHLHQHIVIDTAPRCNNIILLKQRTNPTIDLPKIFQEALQVLAKKETKKTTHTIKPSDNQKACYHCTIISQSHDNDKENLIIHRDKHRIIMFDHHAKRTGHLIIIPTHHTENIATMNKEEYYEMNNLGIKIYPLLLNAIGACDINFGFTSYGENGITDNAQHLQLNIIPRKEEFLGSIAIISNKNAIIAQIDKLYECITEQFKKLI